MLRRSCVLLALGLAAVAAPAQLAITETMSSASTNLGVATVEQGPDYWELSNFGSSPIDLSGYRFNDADATLGGDANSTTLQGITIAPGESIILVQSGTTVVTDRDSFIAWWGATNVPENLQVLFYSGNGQSSSGDSIVLWDATATGDAEYVDRADFGEAVRGRSFTYDTNGLHAVLSENGLRKAFKAVTSDDEGSPGTNNGPVALILTQQPTPASFTTPASFNATYTAAAKGLPRPHYQWRLNGVPISGATYPSLSLTNLQLADAGNYTVVVTNGLQAVTSSVAVLNITTTPVPPSFLTTPASAIAFEGQLVQLGATASGSPTPTYQWQFNGTNLVGETSATLTLSGVQSNQAGVYTVVASSAAGTNAASATLGVTAKPRLLITEVHSTGSTPNADWWELTSFENYPINLKGWRFDDSSHSLAPNNALTNTADVIIHPGESIVFVEGFTPAQFRGWWPTMAIETQIVRYSGGGIGLSSAADEINLWNAVTVPGNELTERISWYAFASAPLYTGFVYDPENLPLGNTISVLTTNTTLGLAANGMLTATNGAVGSPGRVVAPVFATNSINGSVSVVAWNTFNSRQYVVQVTTNLVTLNWITISNVAASASTEVMGEPVRPGERYYRVATVIPLISQ
ncbi:MAG: immunoglobulin domain-containing protein [Verrucomicrobiota bacterium]